MWSKRYGIHILILLSAFLFAVAQGYAQSDMEIGGNISVGLSKKFAKRVGVSLDEELRLMDDTRVINRFGSTLGVSYQIVKKYLKGGVSYGALLYNKEYYMQFNQRLSGYLTGEVGAGNFDFSLRAKYQATFKDERFKDRKVNPDQRLRGRLAVDYKIARPKLFPYVSAEVYYDLIEKDLSRVAYTVGMEHKFDKRNSMELSVQFNDKLKRDILYINIGYSHKF